MFENAVQDGLGEIGIVEHLAPGFEGFVGGEDHGSLVQVAIIDDLEEDIGSIRAVGEIPDFVDDQDRGMGVSCQNGSQPAFATGGG